MTGKELIKLIIDCDALGEEIFTKEGLAKLGYVSEVEMAAKFEVDSSIVHAWCVMGQLKCLRFGEEFVIQKDEIRPIY